MMTIFKKIFILTILFFIPVLCQAEQYYIEKFSGDEQLGIRGSELKEDFVIKLTDSLGTPVANAEITFSIVENTGITQTKNLSYFLTKDTAFTDDKGFARIKMSLGKKSSDKVTVIANAYSAKSVTFTVSVLDKHWILLMFIGILGGTALLLFGMFKINTAFQKLAGNNIRTILTKFTSTRIKGFTTGFLVTALNQSSTATLLLQITLAGAGVLTFFQSISVSVGASVGSTVTGQLVAFRLADYALLITAVGYFLSFFSSKKKLANFGEAVFGFGLLFFGMKIMSDSMMPVTLNTDLLNAIASVQSPLIAINTGLLFTILIQSSGATVGIVIVLASSGILSLMQGVCICLGSQIGTCITTAAIGCIGQPRSGKRVMLWHLSYQVLGVVLVYPFIASVMYNGESSWLYFVKFFTDKFICSGDIARQIAMSHTLVTIFAAFIVLPFVPLIHKFFMYIYPDKTSGQITGTVFIDEKYLNEPAKALELSKKEISRLSEIVSLLFKDSLKALKTRHKMIYEKIVFRALQVTELLEEIVPYLTKIGQNELTPKQSQEEISLLYIAADFEQISDVIHRNLMYASREKISRHLRFSEEGLTDIKYLHGLVYANMSEISDAFINGDTSGISEIYQSVHKFRNEIRNFKKKHIARLHSGLQESIETSGLHMDILDQYIKINDILMDIIDSLISQNN